MSNEEVRKVNKKKLKNIFKILYLFTEKREEWDLEQSYRSISGFNEYNSKYYLGVEVGKLIYEIFKTGSHAIADVENLPFLIEEIVMKDDKFYKKYMKKYEDTIRDTKYPKWLK